MFKGSFIVLICVFWTSLAFAQRDAIDLTRAVVYNSPADVATWPITTRVESLTMSPEGTPDPGIAMYFSGRRAWPDYTPPGWPEGGEGLQYTIWAGVRINGTWHVSGFIRMWRTRVATGAPILTHPPGCPSGGNNFACNWAYDARWGPMNGYQPRAGEAMVFFATAGVARGVTTVTSVRERTNVVMVNLPANDTGSFEFDYQVQTDLLIDFGAGGLWTLNDASDYAQVSGANPKNTATGDLDGNGVDDVIVDFGSGVGIWIRWNGSLWTRLHSDTADSIVTGDIDYNGRAEIVIGFTGAGTYVLWNFTAWGKLSDQTASQILITNIDGGGMDVVLDFPGSGLWIFRNGTSWIRLHGQSPRSMVAGDFDGNGKGDVAFAFPGAGVWFLMNSVAWAQVHGQDAVHLAAGHVDANRVSDLVIDFGAGSGSWLLRNSALWSPLHSLPAQEIVLGDLDGNGQEDIIFNFGTAAGGVWVLANLNTWAKAHSMGPDQIVVGSFN